MSDFSKSKVEVPRRAGLDVQTVLGVFAVGAALLVGVMLLVALAGGTGAAAPDRAARAAVGQTVLAEIGWPEWSSLSAEQQLRTLSSFAAAVEADGTIPAGSRLRFQVFVVSCANGTAVEAELSDVSVADTVAVCAALFR